MPKHMKSIEAWFEGLNASRSDIIIPLFDSNPIIRNAANPPLSGPKAAEQLLTDFFDRTVSREFKVLGVAEGDGMTFAWWQGVLSFRPGIQIGNVRITRQFSVTLQGVERFVFNETSGKIRELDIIHETTTVARTAREHGEMI